MRGLLISGLLTLASLSPAAAYEPDYEVRGVFLMEAANAAGTWTEVWDLDVLRGHIRNDRGRRR